MARTVSRSVKIPMSRPPSMISADPILFRAISEIASPTVVEGSTEYSVVFMTSRTVATPES
jgi:hypothetical protein